MSDRQIIQLWEPAQAHKAIWDEWLRIKAHAVVQMWRKLG